MRPLCALHSRSLPSAAQPMRLRRKTLADANGMTLYTFDADTGGTPTCYDDCATKWPPYLAKEGDAMKEDGDGYLPFTAPSNGPMTASPLIMMRATWPKATWPATGMGGPARDQ